jgi:hypothetical protein
MCIISRTCALEERQHIIYEIQFTRCRQALNAMMQLLTDIFGLWLLIFGRHLLSKRLYAVSGAFGVFGSDFLFCVDVGLVMLKTVLGMFND